MAKLRKIPHDPQDLINFFRLFKEKLSPIYSICEAENIFYIITEDMLNISRTDIFTNSVLISKKQKDVLLSALEKLTKYTPVQYVTGKSYFYGNMFFVNKSVLIPRPETEELVHLFINENKIKNPEILDIGTGSGCIAVSVKKSLPGASVTAIDHSAKALNIARRNAFENNTEIRFIKLDFTDKNSWNKFSIKFDYIVCNPPYVTESDKLQMNRNVLDYEPHEALFVTDSRPLFFYELISEFGLIFLKDSGKIYCEINENFGQELILLFAGLNYKNIRLLKDLNNKDRFIVAER